MKKRRAERKKFAAIVIGAIVLAAGGLFWYFGLQGFALFTRSGQERLEAPELSPVRNLAEERKRELRERAAAPRPGGELTEERKQELRERAAAPNPNF